MLDEIVSNKSLKPLVTVYNEVGSNDTLEETFKLCSDQELVSLGGRMGGPGTSLACFLCPWNERDEPFGDHCERTGEDLSPKGSTLG